MVFSKIKSCVSSSTRTKKSTRQVQSAQEAGLTKASQKTIQDSQEVTVDIHEVGRKSSDVLASVPEPEQDGETDGLDPASQKTIQESQEVTVDIQEVGGKVPDILASVSKPEHNARQVQSVPKTGHVNALKKVGVRGGTRAQMMRVLVMTLLPAVVLGSFTSPQEQEAALRRLGSARRRLPAKEDPEFSAGEAVDFWYPKQIGNTPPKYYPGIIVEQDIRAPKLAKDELKVFEVGSRFAVHHTKSSKEWITSDIVETTDTHVLFSFGKKRSCTLPDEWILKGSERIGRRIYRAVGFNNVRGNHRPKECPDGWSYSIKEPNAKKAYYYPAKLESGRPGIRKRQKAEPIVYGTSSGNAYNGKSNCFTFSMCPTTQNVLGGQNLNDYNRTT